MKPYFLPFIGSEYLIGVNGSRILVLGESHYCKPEDEHPLITRNCIEAIIQKKWRWPFWTKIARIVSGNSDPAFWNQVAFYNFIQQSVGTKSRMRPTPEMWQGAKSPFLSTLEDLQPDIVLVCGRELWGHLPKGEVMMKGEGKYRVTISTVLAGTKKIRLIGISHPSSPSFGRINEWQKIISELLAY